MLHACCSLLTGTQAEGRREGPRPVGIEAVQLHRRVGEIACAHAARDGPRGRTSGAGPGGSRGVERRRLLLSARPVARSMAARRAVAILVSGSRAAGHAPPRSTPSRRGCIARGVLMDVLQLSTSGQRTRGRVDRAPSHAATSNSLLMN